MSKNKYIYNFDAFYKPSPISYYLLGAYMTDGCIEIQKYNGKIYPRVATLSSNDVDWLDLIRNIICKELPISKSGGCHKLKLCSTELCGFLIQNKCLPTKTLTLEFPNVPDEYLPDFVRGCIDGDGSIYYYTDNDSKRYECYLCGSSLKFLEVFRDTMLSKGFKCTLTQQKQKHNQNKISIVNGKPVIAKNDHYRVKLRGKNAIRFLNWIYYPGHSLSLPRKALKAKVACEEFSHCLL